MRTLNKLTGKNIITLGTNPEKYLKFFGACVIWTMVLNNEEYFFLTKVYFKNNLFYFSVILVVLHSPIFYDFVGDIYELLYEY
jgi:hypothetical protein